MEQPDKSDKSKLNEAIKIGREMLQKIEMDRLDEMARGLSQQMVKFNKKGAVEIREEEKKTGLVEIASLLYNYRVQLLESLSSAIKKHGGSDEKLRDAIFEREAFNEYSFADSQEVTHYKKKVDAVFDLLETINLGTIRTPAEKRYEEFVTKWKEVKGTLASEYHTILRPTWLVYGFAAVTSTAMGNKVKSYEQILVDDMDKVIKAKTAGHGIHL